MLFTTTTFCLLFLPIVLVGYYAIGGRSSTGGALLLFAASVFFYGWWMPQLTVLLLLSIVANFVIGLRIQRAHRERRAGWAKAWIFTGIVFNLGLLGYFKYANFLVDSLSALLSTPIEFHRVVLPIGISFYTFTQIAYLVDTYQRKVTEVRWVHYGLFVTYFPHLVAGPVLHHAQMMPQFADEAVYGVQPANFVAGLAIFLLGLAKKVLLADGVSPYADAVFAPVDSGASPSPQEAWLGTLAYTAQLYFDFSGYSDMAIGLSWMFNIRLPYNFNSPYKATSISEFWRRWHISLSTFLRDYLYVALGGNRKGPVRRYLNLAATMVLGGLWHGSAWTFVVWGGLHGLYLGVNHGFRAAMDALGLAALRRHRLFILASWALTMLAVMAGWVFFRATTFEGAGRMLLALAGMTEIAGQALLWNAGLQLGVGLGWCAALLAVAALAPNSNAIGERLLALCRHSGTAGGYIGGAALAGVLLLVVLNAARDSVSAFIYFNF
jgi:alginate O-acetyltransferase complex protein AlgI